ncbi:MAG: hypothetical protein H7Z14_09775 [Anaerolineae bacterium]|nr:hypothetical protein [Phycisphaerae bacterium]
MGTRRFQTGIYLLSAVIATQARLATAGNGDLPTSRDNYSIPAADVLDNLADLPAGCKRLIIATQCFGGTFVRLARGKADTAAASGSDDKTKTTTGGYDKGATDQTKPESGNNGKKVHDSGDASKTGRENPQSTDGTAGNTPLQDVSLEPTSDSGAVYSRHILIYAGRPEPTDKADRDKIKNAFQGQARTTVLSVGGGRRPGSPSQGTDGWDRPADGVDLIKAMEELKAQIMSSAHPEREQFIFYVMDHGVEVRNTPATPNSPPTSPGQRGVIPGVQMFRSTPTAPDGEYDIEKINLIEDTENVPGFNLFIPFTDATYAYDPFGGSSFFQPGDWSLQVGSHSFASFSEGYRDLGGAGDYVVGDSADEGISLFFPVPESLFLNEFFDTTLDVSFDNLVPVTGGPRFREWLVGSVTQTSGAMAQLPEPTSAMLLLIGACRLIRRRRGHRNGGD